MANNVQYTIGFNADTSQAKKELENLVASLQKVSKMSLETPIKDSSIKAASDAAQELQKHLQAAMDVNTGKLNLNTFNNSLKNANMSVSQLGASLLEAGQGGKTAFMQLASSIANAEVPIKRMNSTLSKWETTLKNTVKWEISSNVVHGLERALSGAVSYVKNLNGSLNDIRIVTGYSADDMTRFAQQANKAAKGLSTTTKAYVDASLIYFQQGDSADMVAKKAAITTKAANVAFSASAEEMSEMLTAVWNSYQVGEAELEKYVDIMAALGAATATSTEEIATAMQKVAATANTVGVSMEQMSSIIATVASVTREAPESIGTSFKTILARMGDLKVGKTLEDGMSLGTVSSQLAAVGVNILDTTGELKDMGGVIEELMGKWQGMTSAEKTAIAQAVAGKRQYTQLMALMENQDMYKESMNIAGSAKGTLQKQVDIYTESWEGASKRVQAALESIYSQLINDKALVSLLKFAEKFVDTISGAIQGFGGLGGVIANVGGLFAQYFSADIAAGLIKSVTKVKDIFTDFRTQQAAFLDNQRSFRSEISKLTENELLTDGDRNQLASIQKISEAKSAMLEKSKLLTEEQRASIEGVIAAYENQAKVIQQISSQYDSLQKSTKDQEKQITDQTLLAESRIVAKKEKRNYFQGNSAQRHKDWEKAKLDIVTDSNGIDFKPSVNFSTIKGEIKELQDAWAKLNITAREGTKGITFDQIINSAKDLNMALGSTNSALQQLNNLGHEENGVSNLFASGSASTENVIADLRNVYNEYVEIVNKMGQENKLKFSFTDDLSTDQLNKMFDQLRGEMVNLQTQVTDRATLIKQAILAMVPPELSSEFESLFQKWEQLGAQGLKAPENIKEAWKSAADTMSASIDAAVSKSQQRLQALVQTAFALTQLTATLNSIINAVKTISSPDTSGWEKFGAIITIISSAIMSLKSITTIAAAAQAAYNALIIFGASAQTSYANAMRDSAAATAQNTKEQIKNMAAQKAKDIIASKGTAKVLGSGLLKVGSLALGKIGAVAAAAAPWLLLAVAVAGVGYAIYKNITAEDEWIKAGRKRADEIDKNVAKNEEASKKLNNDMTSLATIMNDTSMAYDDQIKKINEIAQAYGVQASAIDGVTDSYAALQNRLSGAVSAQAKKQLEIAKQNVEEAKTNSNSLIEKTVHKYGSDDSAFSIEGQLAQAGYYGLEKKNWISYDAVSSDLKGYKVSTDTYGDYFLTQYDDENAVELNESTYYQWLASKTLNLDPDEAKTITSREAFEQAYKDNDTISKDQSIFSKLNEGTAGKVNLIGENVWKHYSWSADGNISGLTGSKRTGRKNALAGEDKNVTAYSGAEGQLFTSDTFAKALAQFGFYFDKGTASVNNLPGANLDYAGLYQFLTTSNDFRPFLNNENSYINAILTILRENAIDTLANNEQKYATFAVKSKLWDNDDFRSTVFSTEKQSVEDTQKLINDIIGESGINNQYKAETISAVLSDLSGYASYADSSKIIGQEYQIALNKTQQHAKDKGITMTPADTAQMQQNIVDLLQKEFPEIDLETIIKISPSDIKIDDDGNVQLKDGIKEYISKQGELSTVQTSQKLLKENNDLLTKDTFDRSDLKTLESLKSQGAFDDNFNIDAFAKLSPAARKAMLTTMQRNNNQKEKDLLGNEDFGLLAEAKIRADQAKIEYNTAIEKYDEANGGKGKYQEQATRKANLTTQNTSIQAAYDEYSAKGESEQGSYDWADLLTSLGYEIKDNQNTKGAAGKKLVDEIFAKNNLEIGDITASIGEIEALGDAFVSAQADADKLDKDIKESKYQEWLDKVDTSTKKAEKSTNALGKRGRLTAEELAELSVEYGQDIYSKYQNMSDDQWDKYMYENALSAYNELYNLRAGDLAAQAEILQQKKQLEAEYWDATAIMRNKDYNERMKQYEKDLEIQKNATNAMQNNLTTGQATSSQQQAIANGGYNWQFGDSQEAMRNRLSAYGAGLLNQTMQQLNINNAKKGKNLQEMLLPDLSKIKGHNIRTKQMYQGEIFTERKEGLAKAVGQGEEALKAYLEELTKAGVEIDTATANMLMEMAKNPTEYANLTFDQMYVKYQQMNKNIDKDNSELWANFEDGAISAITSVIDAETEAAETVFSVWETTYKAIAEARLGLANGQSVAESMLGDVDSQAALVRNLILNNPNITNEEIIKALHSTSETDAGALVTPTELSLTNYGASRGIISAILTEKEAEKLGNGHKAGDILENQAEYEKITTDRLTAYESEFKEQLAQNEEMQTAYTEWLKANGKTASDMSSETIIDYLKQQYGLDETKIGDTFATERGTEIVYVSNQEAQDITDTYGRAKAQYDTTYEKSSQQLSDWQAIYNASLQSDKGTISEVLGDSAAEIAARLGLKDVKDLDTISSDYAKSQIESAQVSIGEAQVTFNGAVDALTSSYGGEAISSVLGKTLTDDAETIKANTAAATSQAEAVANGQVALETYASSLGVSENELKAFTQDLIDNGKIVGGNAEQQIKAAAAVMRQNKGYTAVQSSLKGYMKELTKAGKGTNAYYSTIENIRSIYGDVFDLTKDGMKNLSTDLLESADNAKLLEDAAKGDTAAFDELQSIVAKDLTQNIKVNIDKSELDALIDEIAVYDFGDIEIGADLNDAPFYDKLNSMVLASSESAQAMSDALSSMGVDATIQKHEVWVPDNPDTVTFKGQVPIIGPDGVKGYENVSSSITQSGTGHMETWYTIEGAKYNGKGVSSGTANKSKGGGGGGGGGKAKKIDKKKPEDEKERYHHVNKVLERLSNQLDEIDKKKSRVYGKSYLDYISQEIALTEKQCDTYQRYIDEAKEYLALDTQRVASLGATFDEFGNIENYDQVMDNIMGKYNEFVDRYNAMSASEQTAAEEEKTKWDKWYEEKKKWIENYEETVSTIYDQQNNLLEAQNKISEKTLEGIQYKVEIHVDMTEAEKDFLDYLNDTYDGLLEKQGDVMNNLVRETELATSNLDALGQSKEELDAAFASGKLNQADYVEGLKDVNKQILDNLSNIQDLKKEIEELYGNTLEMASDAFDKQTEKVKNASEAMSSYISILGLIGKGSNLKDLTKFYDSQYEYNLQSLEMQKEYLDILRSEEQYYLDRMSSAEGLTETERQQYEDLEKTIADVNSNILSDTESTLNQIAEAFNNEIEIIFKDLEERIAGVGNSVQDLADAYQYYQEEQSRYVTSAKELYEVNKLNRQIEKTMNETSSKINKNLLAALQDRINKQSELNELTEYDIEMNQLQYELLLKKIALEEAQNAKSTVRLTRDSGGNYVYQYTADQDDIMTKQQEYEDVLQQINDLSVNRVQDLESQLLEIYQNTLSKIKEIAQDQTLTEEEKYDKIQTIMNQFKEQTNFIQEQYQIASDNLITSNLAISEHYGQQLVEHSENAKNGLNQTIAAMIQDTEGLQQALEDVCANKIPAAMDTMQSRIDAVTAAVNLDYNTMSESVNTYNKVTKDAQDQTNETANSLNKDLLPAIHSATTAWDTYMGKLKNVISTYESMYQSILKTIQAQAKLSNATAPSTVKSSGTGKFSDTTTPSATGNTDTGSGDGGGDSGGRTGAGGEYTTITYKVLTTAGPAQGKAIGGSPSGPKKLAVGSTGTFSHNPSPGFVMGGWSISDPSKLSISGKIVTALAAGSVVVTVKYWDRRGGSTTTGGSGGGGLKNQVMFKYATGGLADFTGPAWLDGSKSKPEMVLNAKDTENILTAVQGVRALDASTLSMLNKYITNASLAMSFGLGNISAGSVYGTTDTIQQEVHITAEFPNATNSAEIQDAFDNIINRATQYITTKR